MGDAQSVPQNFCARFLFSKVVRVVGGLVEQCGGEGDRGDGGGFSAEDGGAE